MQKTGPAHDPNLNDPAHNPEISLEASATLDKGHQYDVQELLDDWPDSSEDTEFFADRLQEQRNELVARAVARLNELFTNHLQALSTGHAGSSVCSELAQITKLTFLRVKDSPAAWAALGPDDHAIVVRALRSMAARRKAATEVASNKRAASKELEAGAEFEAMFKAMEAGGAGAGLDLGFGV